MSMTIAFSCPNCRTKIEVPGSLAGKRGKCKQCGGPIQIPIPRQANPVAIAAKQVEPVIAAPISFAPASAQVAVDTPIGGVRVGPQRRYYRDYDRPGYRSYGYDRRYRSYDRGCRTVTIQRDDGSFRRIRAP